MICRRGGEFDAGGRGVADSAAYLLARRPDFQLGSGIAWPRLQPAEEIDLLHPAVAAVGIRGDIAARTRQLVDPNAAFTVRNGAHPKTDSHRSVVVVSSAQARTVTDSS